LEKAKAMAEKKGVSLELKEVEADPWIESTANAILDEISRGDYDMVILGARGRTLSSEISIGSKALAVAINAPTTVVIVR